ncbi:MAG: hypothetical protein DWQ04_33080 [Chloroflexi bacterium]|nr:MAG: hypothetical protein DWQ04_33080 [Chloroflexota bacterium]
MITKDQLEQMRLLFFSLVKKRAAEQPLVLVIEDLQWGDPSTVEWLGQSIGSLVNTPCLTLFIARPEFNPPWLSHEAMRQNFHSLTLDSLRPKASAKIIAELAGEHLLDETMRHQIVAKTDGIPLFIEELTKSLIEDPSIENTTTGKSKIPMTLLDSLVSRLDHLGKAKESAQWAAVIDREFSYALLEACVPFEAQRLQDDLAHMIEAELVSPIGRVSQNMPARYMFKHGLVQDAAYTTLLKRTRLTYHQHVAQILETHFPQITESQPELLAEYHASGNNHTRAVDFWLLAGNRAKAHGALTEAKTFFNHAVQWIEPEDSERRWQALVGREDVLDLRGEREAQKKDIDALLELAETSGDDVQQMEAYNSPAIYAVKVNDFELQLYAAEASIAAARRTGNLILEVRQMPRKVDALVHFEDWTAAEQAAEETLTKLSEVTDDETRTYVFGLLAYSFGRMGDEIPGMSEGEVISAGFQDLMQHTDKISDADWRQSFLDNVIENGAIVERWERLCVAVPE